jgi:hypothetical protein
MTPRHTWTSAAARPKVTSRAASDIGNHVGDAEFGRDAQSDLIMSSPHNGQTTWSLSTSSDVRLIFMPCLWEWGSRRLELIRPRPHVSDMPLAATTSPESPQNQQKEHFRDLVTSRILNPAISTFARATAKVAGRAARNVGRKSQQQPTRHLE